MLRNLKIRTKLVALLVLPLVALAVFASLQVVTAQRNRADADRVSRIAGLATSLTDLTDALQRERARTLGYLASGSKRQAFGTMLSDQVLVNEQRQTFNGNVATLDLSTFPKAIRDDLTSARQQLSGLDQERKAIENGQAVPQSPPSVDAANAFYSRIITAFLNVNNEIAGQTNDNELSRNVNAFAAIGQLKEAVSQQQGILYAALRNGSWAQGQYNTFTREFGAEQVWNTQFLAQASAAQRDVFTTTVKGTDVSDANKAAASALTNNTTLPSRLRKPPPGQPANEDAPLVEWFEVTSAKSNLIKSVQNQVAGDVAAVATRLKNDAQSRATTALTAGLLVLALTIGMSLILARSLTRPLRALERAANHVAEQDLPGVVEQLAQTDHVNLRDIEVEPVAIDSDDEIGRVAKAFNSVHSVAVRTATEQAALRKSIGDMFINLARRSQSLIDRQLNFIEDMERAEDDPDELAKLFQLDHLATRMRRNAENLIVLSSAEVARRWSEPVALADIIRAAISEVEDFTRVELLTIDEVQIAGHAVNDVVHLLAELVENATTFSPPETPVKIAGQGTPNGHLIEIEDRGLGMTDEELVQANERLASPPMIDFALSRILGFFVVGRLAQRNGIKVQLRHSWYGGVTALILIPPNLLLQPGLARTLPGDAQDQRQGFNGLAELPPPAPAMAGAVRGGDSPIFEATRSDWFESGLVSTHLPLRPHKLSVGDPRNSATVTGPTGQRLFPTTPPRPSAPPPAAPPPPPYGGPGGSYPGGPGSPSPYVADPGGPADPRAAAAAAASEAAASEAVASYQDPGDVALPDGASSLSSAPTESFPATSGQEQSWEQELRSEPEPGRGRPAEAPESPLGAPAPASAPEAAPAAASYDPAVDPAAATGPIPRPMPKRVRQPAAEPPPPPPPQPQPRFEPDLGPASPAPTPAPSPASASGGGGLPYRDREREREWRRDGGSRGQPRFAAGGGTARPGAAPPPSPQPRSQPQPAQVAPQLSPAGLPRRTPRANLAPGLAASMEPGAQQAQSAPGAGRTAVPGASGRTRSPDDIRNLLTSYRAGLLHGRMDAASTGDPEGPSSEPSSRAGDGPAEP